VEAEQESGSDVELDDEDYNVFQEFGDRVEFLNSLHLAAPAAGAAKAKGSFQDQGPQPRRAAAPAAAVAPPVPRAAVTEHSDGASADTSDDNAQPSDGEGEGEEAYERGARARQPRSDAKLANALPFKMPDGTLRFERARGRDAATAVLASGIAGVTVVDDLASAADAVPATAGADAPQADKVPNARPRPSDAAPAPQAEAPEATQRAAPTPRRAPPPGQVHDAKFRAKLAELQDAQAFQDRAARVEAVKQQIALAGSKLLESPQENVAQLRLLLELGLDQDTQVHHTSVLCLLKQSAAVRRAMTFVTGPALRSGTQGTAGAPCQADGLCRCRAWRCCP
jgi:hypothetical protein